MHFNRPHEIWSTIWVQQMLLHSCIQFYTCTRLRLSGHRPLGKIGSKTDQILNHTFLVYKHVIKHVFKNGLFALLLCVVFIMHTLLYDVAFYCVCDPRVSLKGPPFCCSQNIKHVQDKIKELLIKVFSDLWASLTRVTPYCLALRFLLDYGRTTCGNWGLSRCDTKHWFCVDIFCHSHEMTGCNQGLLECIHNLQEAVFACTLHMNSHSLIELFDSKEKLL